jgi:hypothetical protein
MNCSTSSTCAAPANNCLSNQDCVDFLDCIQLCMDESCTNTCVSTHPTGSNLYFLLMDCAMCTACPVDCALEGQGFCP